MELLSFASKWSNIRRPYALAARLYCPQKGAFMERAPIGESLQPLLVICALRERAGIGAE